MQTTGEEDIMMGRLAALAAAVMAAAAATGAALMAWRRKRRAEARAQRRRAKAARPKRQRAARGQGSAPPAGRSGAPVSSAPSGQAIGAGSAASTPTTVSDPLRSIKGIGTVSAERLGAMGITTTGQVAAWKDEDVERVAAEIKVSAERIRREDWVGQARALAED